MARNSPVRARGIDSSGRTIWMSDYQFAWWEGLCWDLGFTPTIVQSGWQSKNPGGGAAASAGYHDLGGALDLRTWNLDSARQSAVIRLVRLRGAMIWKRDAAHGGMDEHFHLGLPTDTPIDSGLQWQWWEYVAGRDGLATRGPDYHWRPKPLVQTPPKEAFMPTVDDIAKAVWGYEVPVLGSDAKARAAAMLAQIHNRAGDTRTLAKKLKAAGIPVDESTIESALRKVLGSLDKE